MKPSVPLAKKGNLGRPVQDTSPEDRISTFRIRDRLRSKVQDTCITIPKLILRPSDKMIADLLEISALGPANVDNSLPEGNHTRPQMFRIHINQVSKGTPWI